MKTTVSIELEIPHPDGAIPVEVWGVVREIRDRCDTDRGVQELDEYDVEAIDFDAPTCTIPIFVDHWIYDNLATVGQKIFQEYINQPERA